MIKEMQISSKIAVINAIALYDTGANMSCISYTCNVILKDPPSFKLVPAMLVHLATQHELCLIELMCCDIMKGNS